MFFDLSTWGVNGCFALTFAFMAAVARALPREYWAHVGELLWTGSIDATTAERRAVLVRVTAQRARKMDQEDVVMLREPGPRQHEAQGDFGPYPAVPAGSGACGITCHVGAARVAEARPKDRSPCLLPLAAYSHQPA